MSDVSERWQVLGLPKPEIGSLWYYDASSGTSRFVPEKSRVRVAGQLVPYLDWLQMSAPRQMDMFAQETWK